MDGRKSTMLRVLTNAIAFILLIAIATLMIVSKCTSQIVNISIICEEVAKLLAFSLVSLASFWYVMSKRGAVLKIVWAMCVAVIVVLAFI